MEPDTNRNSIKIKYQKTSCYFCNEWLDSQSFTEHIIHCGQMLVECPRQCSAYIQRKKIRSHLLECPKSKILNGPKSKSMKCNKNEVKMDLPSNVTLEKFIENRIAIMEQDITALRTVLNEEIKQRLHLITDVGSLRKHNQILNEWSQKVSDALPSLKKCLTEEQILRKNEVDRINLELRKLYNKNIFSKEWQVKINNQLNDFEAEINKYEDKLYALEENFTNRLNVTENLMEDIEKNLNKKFIKNSEYNTKQMKLDFEVKNMKIIVCETEERCDKIAQNISNLEISIQKTNQTIIDLENNLTYQSKLKLVLNTKGHLIWKIPDYSKELEKAKQFDNLSILGPIFLNKPFGYTLRLEVYLNGIGKWKGRNLFACLNVIRGEYDDILPWPCRLQADIILKDQNCTTSRSSSTNQLEESPCIDDPQDYIKTTIVKKKYDDYHSNQYIHVSHRTINTRNYLKNDCIYIEIKIHKNCI